MSSFIVNPPQNFPCNFDGFFFNENDFISQGPAEEKFTFICLSDDLLIKARFILFIRNSEGLSPWRAPFGSFELAEDFSDQELHDFIMFIDKFALEKKLTGIKINSWPDCYNPEKAIRLKKALLNNGFDVTIQDHNYHLITHSSFEDLIHVSEKGKLRKAAKAGFRFEIGNSNDIGKIHSLVSEARKLRGYPVTMNLEDYEEMFRRFPDRYILFTLYDNNKLIAVCTGVKINSKILYNFFGANDISYKSYSPMVMLLKEVYEYCVKNGYHIFDLGTASANGIVNPGVNQFKKYLGGELSYKYTFQKKYV
jgi:hypothetical protein